MTDAFDIKQGDIRFVDNFVPRLFDGEYTVTVTRSSTDRDNLIKETTGTSTRDFTVTGGMRFKLDPADIYKEYPPKGSQGQFDKVLPHIVLTKQALPWERNIFNDPVPPPTPPENHPWLALVVLDCDQIIQPAAGTNKGKNTPTGATTITLSELLSPESSVLGPDVTLDNKYESSDETCQVVDISPDTFKTAIPKKENLRYLAHCREVNIRDKSEIIASSPINGTQCLSVVVGGRFPSSKKGNDGKYQPTVVHLISLEGFEKYLNGSNLPGEIKKVRMVSMTSWYFTCLPDPARSFAGLMNGLVQGGKATKESLELKLPVNPISNASADQIFAQNVINAGYVPCTYQTRQGEKTFSWYRGPLTPQPVKYFAKDRDLFLAAPQAMVYDDYYGLFDHSYAAAFETGRMLALADKNFGTLLLNWRRNAHRKVDLLYERISKTLLDTDQVKKDLSYYLTPNRVTTDFLKDLTGRLINHIEDSIKSPSTVKVTVNIVPGPTAPGSTDPLKTKLDTFFNRADIQQSLLERETDSEELESICSWLARLYLLYGVPFNNLAADKAMLPKESIRFFYLDRNWSEFLVEGAMSIGIQNSRDFKYQEAMFDIIRKKVHRKVHSIRGSLLAVTTPAGEDEGDNDIGGLLLRSAVVSGWPGLEIRGYKSSDGKTPSGPIRLLRMDHLADDVLLCIFAEVPAWIEIDEPKESLHFGTEDDYQIDLRKVGDPGTGTLIPQPTPPIKVKLDGNMLDIQAMLPDLQKPLELNRNPYPAEFALQMIWAPEKMVFQDSSQSYRREK